VVKAQVHAGGRGKAGGVKLADDPAGAEAAAKQILGMMLKTPQTPPEGIKVLKVLVEEASPIATELYLSMTLDRGRGTHVVMASQAGGMEIEEVAATHPEKIIREWTDPALGLQAFQARNLAFGLGLSSRNRAGPSPKGEPRAVLVPNREPASDIPPPPEVLPAHSANASPSPSGVSAQPESRPRGTPVPLKREKKPLPSSSIGNGTPVEPAPVAPRSDLLSPY